LSIVAYVSEILAAFIFRISLRRVHECSCFGLANPQGKGEEWCLVWTDNELIHFIKNQNTIKTAPNLPIHPAYFDPEDGGSMHIQNIGDVSLTGKKK
jgi:hypothetical protein